MEPDRHHTHRTIRSLSVCLSLLSGLMAGGQACAQEDSALPAQEEPALPQTPDFLDAPDPALREIYDINADSDNPRDWRLYGELLLNEGEDEGFSYVARAARRGDARACYIVAEALAYGRYGQEQSNTLALKWLHSALSAGYAPAYELMAAISWDGGWDCLRNTHDAVWYLDKAIAGYTAAEPAAPAQQEKLTRYVRSLKALLAALEQTKDYNWEALGQRIPELKGFTPSFLQMRLSTMPDNTDEGLRQRVTYIQALMEQRRGKFKLGKLADVRLERVDIRAVEAEDSEDIAKTRWETTGTTFSAALEVHTNALPPRPGLADPDLETLRKDAFRLVMVNDALAHELAHVYFCSRYPGLADFSSGDQRMTYEGHATNAAYEFTNATFFQGKLSPERYADLFLSDEYKEYFFWFRENCLSPASLVYWEILDRWERNSGGGAQRPRTRRQDTSGTPAAPALQYFGKAFQGYM